ncbi:MAG: hypothetical protein GWP70_02495 [Proteobacteria bacterium]|nr:hypothetical protein [Pseudomonadota bacterium]
MTSILTRETLDLIARQLDRVGSVVQVTGRELLQQFESIDGFWNGCVEMVTLTTAQMANLLDQAAGTIEDFPGSMEKVVGIGIRDRAGA